MLNRFKKFFSVSGTIAGIAFFTIFLLIIGLQILLNTEKAKRLILEQINKNIPLQLSTETQNLSLFSGTINLGNILLESDKHPVLSVAHLRADIAYLPLLKGVLRFKKLSVETPVVSIKADHAETMALFKVQKEAGDQNNGTGFDNLPINIQISDLSITGGRFHYAQNEPAVTCDVEGIRFSLSDGDLQQQSGHFILNTEKSAITSPEIKADLNTVKFEGQLNKEHLNLILIEAYTEQSHLVVSGLVTDVFTTPVLELSADLDSDLSVLQSIFNTSTELTGPVKINLKASGIASDPEIELALDYGSGKIAGKSIETLVLSCRLKERKLTIKDMEAIIETGNYHLSGMINLQDVLPDGLFSQNTKPEAITWHLLLKQSQLKIDDLIGMGKGISGTLNSRLEIEGSGISPETLTFKGKLETDSPDLTCSDLLAPVSVKLTATGDYKNQVLTLDQLELNTRNSYLHAKGSYDTRFDSLNSDLTIDIPELADFPWLATTDSFGGALNLAAEISGKLKNPQINSRIHAGDLSLNAIKAGDIDAILAFEKGRLVIEKADLSIGKSLIAMSGSIDIINNKTGEIHLDPPLTLTLADSSVFIEDFYEKGSGNLTANGKIKGSMKNRQGVLSLSGKKIDTGLQKIDDAVVALSFNHEKINIEKCVLSIVSGQQITATGMISPVDKHYNLRVLSNGISLSAIDLLRNTIKTPGRLTFDFTGSGNFYNPLLGGSIQITDLNSGGQKRDLHADLKLENKLLSVSGDLGFAVDAQYNIDSMDFKAKADFSDTNLQPLFDLMGHRNTSALITGNLQAEGNASKPEMLTVTADIKKYSMYHNGNKLIQAEAFQASFKEKELTLPGIHLNFQDKGFFDLSGTGRLEGNLDFAVTGNIPAEIIRLYTDEYQKITGNIALAGSLKGTVDTPDFQSQITLTDIGLTIPELMQRLHGVNGLITLTPQAISTETVSGMLDTGSFSLSGNLSLKNFIPDYLDVELSTTALPVNIPDSMEMRLNTELSVRGTSEKSLIEGAVNILEGRYYKDVSLNFLKNIGRKTRQFQPVKKGIDHLFLKDPELKITVKARRPLDIDNNITVMKLHPDLFLYGTINRPLLSGRASVQSGIITYQDKDFEITKGVVDFINPYKVEPAIDITGQTTIQKWTIFLKISGKPDNLEFKLSSDPAEEHWDILSLLTLGKTTAELSVNGSGDSSISAKQQIANMIAKSLQDQIQSETSFDSVEMTYSDGTEENTSDDIKVVVGKKLAERLSLNYGVETRNGVTVQSAGSEYQLFETLLMKAFHDTEGDFGGELVFRLEFR